MCPDQKPLILTIDDDVAIRDSFRSYLEDYDYRVIEAENGRIGLDSFNSNNPDLVLVDLRMPEVDGLEVVRVIKETNPEIPIVVISGTGVIRDAIRALKLGAWDYLFKPIEDLSILSHTIEQSLERARLLRENKQYQQNLENEVNQRTAELKRTNEELKREIIIRESAELKFEKSERMLDSILKTVPDVIYRLDKQGQIIFINDAVKKYGYDPSELIGVDFISLIDADDHEKLKYSMTEQRTGHRRTKDIEVKFSVNVGNIQDSKSTDNFSENDAVVFLIETEGIYDTEIPHAESFVGTQGIARDITEKKQAEAEIQKLKQAVEHSPTPIVITDSKAIIEYVNYAFTEVTGYSKEEVVGKNPRLLKSGETPQQTYKVLWENLIAGKSWHGEFCNRKKNGELYWEIASIAPIYNSLGQITHFVGIKEDITESRQLEQQYQQAQKMEAIGRLAGGIAHDFNNLLTVIAGNSELALMNLDKNDPLYFSFEEISSTASHAADLTRQLLAFSRKQIITPKIVNLNKVLKELNKMLQRIIGEDIRLITEYEENLYRTKTDLSQVEQVIVNIAVNARDAMPDGGNLTIKTSNFMIGIDNQKSHPESKIGKYVNLTIGDTGSGMSSDTLEHIFEPFYTTKGEGKGTGLGLATVFGIVKQNGGFIEVDSELNKGTTFNIYLPRIIGEEEATKKDDLSIKELKGTETIFLVEDDDTLRRMITRSLEKFGYNVIGSESGEDALQKSSHPEFTTDLVITDIVLQGMNGKEFADEFNKMHPDVKVLFTSGYTDTSIVYKSILNEDIPFLQKPYGPVQLVKKIRELMIK